MNARAVNLDTYSLSLLTAKEDILNPRSSTNWAIFTYDGFTNKLKLADSGAGGVSELAGKFHISKPQYGLCKVGNAGKGPPHVALISWVGQNVEEHRRTECASHIPAIRNFFKEAHVFLAAQKMEDLTEEKVSDELSKTQAHAPTQRSRRSSRSTDKEELVGTNYRKTNAAMEMRLINRESFWARAEREEEERKEEERRRMLEDRRRLERERVLKERRDAEERDRKMNEKLQLIEEQRRKRAEQEEELRRKEIFKWEQQQREHEDDMRARLRRSESIEKAAEAAVLVSQRCMNPREFFRQLSSSSQSPTSPGSSRGTGRPFRRYQRSLTDTAFIFSKAEDSTASSPRSPPLVSPFSRAPPSPIYRATSPPRSPDFRPITSPHRPRAPITPPASPSGPAPLASALPGDPQTNDRAQAEAAADEPTPRSLTEPSAPPASPTLLASLSQNLVKEIPVQIHPEVLPASSPTRPECSAFCFESAEAPQTPAAPLPERTQPSPDVSRLDTELASDISYKVQAVLVEEDENEVEQEEITARTQAQPGAGAAGPVQTEEEEEEEQEEEEVEKEEREEDKEEDAENEEQEEVKEDEAEEEEAEEDKEDEAEEEEYVKEEVKKGEQEEDEEEEEEVKKEEQEEDEEVEVKKDEGFKKDAEPASMEEDGENSLSEDRLVPAEPADVGSEGYLPDVGSPHEAVVSATNGMTEGEEGEVPREQNGIERPWSPSDTEPSSPERAVCYNARITAENGDGDNEQKISENGQEVSAERQMCVRALYDYQAEDETEISFEPGDIIRDVETVDKAWWRGWSKDGRQGLFPANYVETI